MLWQKSSLQKDAGFINICAKYIDDSIFRLLESESEKRAEKNNVLSNHFRKKGMEHCRAGNWWEAIEMFNQALCFAENGSTDKGCAYADRSSCYFNLKMYQNCMSDIKLAKSNNCSAFFHLKLKKLNQKCKEILRTPSEASSTVICKPKFSFEVNASCPSLANVVQIETVDANANGISRRITANSDIDVGKTIVIEEGFVWLTSEIYKRCCVCLRADTNLIPCTKCTDSLVCHDTCEKNELHHIECEMKVQAKDVHQDAYSNNCSDRTVIRSILTALHIIPNVSELIRFVERIVSKGESELTTSISTPLSKYAVFLENGLKEIRQFPKVDRKSFYADISRIFEALMQNDDIITLFELKSHSCFLMHLIGHHMCSFRHASSTEIGHNNGSTIYPIVASILRHSCNPNAVLVTSERSTVVVTIQPVKIGDEITVSYIPDEMHLSKKERRKILLKRYKFECKCNRCAGTVEEARQPKVSTQFKNDAKDASNFDPTKISKRKKMTKICADYLNQTDPSMWCDNKQFVMQTYTRLLYSQFT